MFFADNYLSTNHNKINMLRDNYIWNVWKYEVNEEAEILMKQLQMRKLHLDGKTMKFQYYIFGEKPSYGYTLIFGMHGGGGCPPQVNQGQFQNHKHLYDKYLPPGVIWFVPRSCEQASDMWWKSYLQLFFGNIIKAFVLNDIVNPNKIFFTGYSAGGDGVYHLAPMFADWLAGAAMMAGHPNGVQLYNIRNISFSIQVGGQDAAYDRNKLAKQYCCKMQALGNQYGGFKCNYNNIFQEQQHWMKKKDANIFKDFFRQQRNPYPNQFLFKQHPRIQKRYFYYIQVNPEQHKELLKVNKLDNMFYIEGENMKVKIYVNRLMIDYTKPVQIFHNGCLTCMRQPQHNMQILQDTIRLRKDPYYIFQDVFISNPSNQHHQNSTNQTQYSNQSKWLNFKM